MHKLVFVVLMLSLWWMLHAVQVDEELALSVVHEGKRAVDRAAHAAAQQLDEDKLELGVLAIDREEAQAAAARYLQENLRLEPDFAPRADGYLRERVEVQALEIVDETASFPYVYRNEEYDYETIFRRPGVVLIVKIVYPRIFAAIPPIEWELKGSAELVY
ncbi:hypothetical protein [Cohnella sp. AR92]|uniref:hypothetical protein n=1 Tax=Cohnella sp. AR92 TaxID=648716 RepID=UPI000F8EF94A|nr:hypothetical protein [Cohnella sp. AR92]RUS42087.1 hypothetical protein ELR57_27425 [Cohnella sp. AR92]